MRVSSMRGKIRRRQSLGSPLRPSSRTTKKSSRRLPLPPNNAYLFNGRVLHPGDSFFQPDGDVDVLLLPIGGPWLKLSEAVDYVNRVAPRVAIPIHQGGLTEEHRALHCQVIEGFAPQTKLLVLEEGVPTEV